MAGQEKPKVPELEKWYFTKEQLQNSPSRRCGLDADKELAYRQQAANLIQDMGQRLQVSQLCINTAIVYMHRFYAFHSFTQFHRNAIAAAALFLAAKVEEQPRKLEYVIKVAHVCLHRGENVAALTTEQYQEQAQDLVFNENVLLQTLGFDVAIDHPHTHVVRTCHLVKAPKDLAQTSYFMASNSLHLTTMCLQYRPTVVACFCIHLASKWSNWAIPQSSEGRHWFSYVDRSVTCDLLEKLTAEFLHIFDKCPSRLKKKMMTIKGNGSPHGSASSHSNQSSSSQAASPFDKKHVLPTCDDFDKAFDREYERERERRKANVPGGYVPASNPQPTQPPPQKIDYNVYREKKEREERERREERARQLQRPQPHPKPPQPPHATRPTSQHKPGPWPHHKPHDHKVHHKSHSDYKIDHRHHRPIPGPSASATVTAPTAPNPTPSAFPPVEQVPPRTRPPSLFSPENATTPTAAAVSKRPQQTVHRPRQEVRPQPPIVPIDKPLSPKRRPESISTNSTNSVVKDMQPPTILSPFTSPPVREQLKPRQRAPSNSEPELVPVVKKIDETPGFENVIRDAQRGSIKTRPEQKRKESPPIRPLNGIETDPTLVSNLLKESLAKPAPITVQTEKEPPIIERDIKKELPPQPIEIAPPKLETPNQPIEETEHKHKKDKKKKDKHKHKERDKSKEERKKHKKDKDKERKQEAVPAPVAVAPLPPPQPEPINDGTLRITIPREKLATSPGLKIKIPKDRLAAPPPPPPHASGLKIKISKDVLDTSRKRSNPMDVGPPQKMSRQNGAPHHKVSNWRQPNPYRPPMPYFMVQPPPQMFYGMGNPMDGFYYGPPMYPQMQHMHNGQPMAGVHNAHPMSNVHNAHNGSMSMSNVHNAHNGSMSMSNVHNGPNMHNGPPSMHNGPPPMGNVHNGPPPMGNVHNGPPPMPPAHNGHRNHGLPPPLPDMPPPPVPPPPPE